jgi:hypothetical protein
MRFLKLLLFVLAAGALMAVSLAVSSYLFWEFILYMLHHTKFNG